MLRKDPFLHDFLVIVNILLFVSELVYFDWVLLCGSTKIYFILYFEDISLQIFSFAIKKAVLSAACTVAFLKNGTYFI